MRRHSSFDLGALLLAAGLLTASGCADGSLPSENSAEDSGADSWTFDSGPRPEDTGTVEPPTDTATDTGRDARDDGRDVDSSLGSECTAGSEIVCGKTTGECTQGRRTCIDGGWGPCENATEPSPESCDGLDNDCDGDTDEELSRECGQSTGICTTGMETCTDGSWGNCSATSPSTEVCDGKDNDCDGDTDEGRFTLQTFDFEGSNPSWGKVPSGHSQLNVDSDATSGTVPQGSEYARAWYGEGTCTSPSGIGSTFQVNKDVDVIELQANVDVENWGRASIFLEDSSGNVTLLWRGNAKGNGYSTGGWTTLTFDHSTSFQNTTSSGAKVEQNEIPAGIGNESISLIFGTDDETQYCSNGDHGFDIRIDDVQIIADNC